MKAVILAAGKGSRISSVTQGTPKSLLPFGDTTLIGHSLKLFKEAGIDDVIVVTGYKRQDIRNYVDDIWHKPVTYAYNPFYEQTNVLYSFSLAIPLVEKNEDIIFLHADTVFSQEILQRVIDEECEDIVFAVDDHPCEEEEMKVKLDGDYVKLVTKEMPGQEADGEFLGLAKIKSHCLDIIRIKSEELFENGRLLAFFELAVQECIEKGTLSVKSCDVTGLPWQEVDFEEDYQTALKLFEL